MTNAERAAVLKRVVTVLKKNFTVTQPDMTRTPMEQLVYSICLENASFLAADDVYNALTHNYFDWNEVRVSSSRELGETMKNLPEPQQTGLRLKRTLHSIFDQKYSFEIDEIKRMGIKAYNDYMSKMEYVTPFNASYLMMTVLGRHAIPVSSGEFEVLDILGLLDDKDRENNTVSWLERAIEKKKANEFFSLLHQLAALYVKNPFGRKVQDILIAIVPDCKERIPKRRKEESEDSSPKSAQGVSPSPQKADSGKQPSSDKKPETKKAEKPSEVKAAEPKKAEPKKSEVKKAEPKKPEVKKVEPKKAEPKKPEVKKAEPKKAEPKKPEVKKVEPKKPTPKKAEPKKPEVKKPMAKKPVEKPAAKPAVKKVPAAKTASKPAGKTKPESQTSKPVQKKSAGKPEPKKAEPKSAKPDTRKKPK